MIRIRCAPAVLLVAALAACTTSAVGRGTTSTQPTSAVSAAGTEATLASAGIATVADESSARPLVAVSGVPVFTVTAWQAQAMASEAAAHGGVLGSDLDALFPMPKDAPPIAYLIGGWISLGQDAGERAAATIFGSPKPDWHSADQVVFPTEVIALFVADFVRAARTGAPTGDTTKALVTGITDDPCGAVTDFIAQGLAAIFEALKLDPDEVAKYVHGALGGGTVGQIAGAVAHLAASVWNAAVSFFESAAEAALKQLTAPVIHVLQIVLGGLATFTLVVSYLKKETADVTAKAAINRFSVGSEAPRTGTFTASVDTGPDKDWPPALAKCASDVGVTLPKLSRPGEPVTWAVTEAPPGMVTWGPSGTQPLSADLTSTITYTTGHESQYVHDHGESTSGTAWAHVSVRRTEVDQLKNMVSEFAIAQVPDKLQKFVAPMIRDFAEKIAAQFDTLTAIVGTAPVVVRYEVPKGDPCAEASGTYSGTVAAHLAIAMHAPAGSVTITGGGSGTLSGPVKITVTDGKISGSWRLTGTSTGHVMFFSDTHPGLMTGTFGGTVAAPTVSGTLSSDISSASYNGSLHLTHADCHSISGNLIPVFQDLTHKYGTDKYVTITGDGNWTIPHS